MKDSTVINVHFGSGHIRQKAKIADLLERLAKHARGDELEVEPYAVAIILKGEKGHEILHVGFKTKPELREAGRAFAQQIEAPTDAITNE